MSRVFVIADTHFGHANIITVPGRRDLGFTNVVEHDEYLVERWRETVTKRDKVYLMGDIGWDRKGYVTQGILPRLTGQIEVVGGNHDTAELCRAAGNKVHGVVIKYGAVLTHIPVHPQEMFWDINVHGHLHSNVVKKYAHNPAAGALDVIGEKDPRYLCVSCEHIGYRPVELLPLLQDHRERWADAIDRLSPLPPGKGHRDRGKHNR